MNQLFAESDEGWRDSADICALSGDGRHLGHVVRIAPGWIAYDATHMNDTGTDFMVLGTYGSVSEAKAAVEFASGCIPAPANDRQVC